MNDDVCTGTLLVHACHVISFLLDVIIILWILVKWLALCYCPVSDIDGTQMKSCTYHYRMDRPH